MSEAGRAAALEYSRPRELAKLAAIVGSLEDPS
jgi:hypothetical protein